ncbi:hypothetical protein [Gluconacetobacter entanii]|uniref:hypothetical protein n=1 Tax=Gluconacetobacter entanii TaxID=108528 RepID=UPI00142DDD1F|nr:hypothetical protein [Gluconacetobacter entanii]MCE2579489.1 hypothetical protein [Komagataeibacter sp. FNDCR1]
MQYTAIITTQDSGKESLQRIFISSSFPYFPDHGRFADHDVRGRSGGIMTLSAGHYGIVS